MPFDIADTLGAIGTGQYPALRLVVLVASAALALFRLCSLYFIGEHCSRRSRAN